MCHKHDSFGGLTTNVKLHSYFLGATKTFDDICFYCGEEKIYLGPEVQKKKEEYSTVRPICEGCFKAGKEIRATIPIKMKKQRKQ